MKDLEANKIKGLGRFHSVIETFQNPFNFAPEASALPSCATSRLAGIAQVLRQIVHTICVKHKVKYLRKIDYTLLLALPPLIHIKEIP